MRCILVGNDSVHNRGCEAITRSTLLMLNKEFQELKVVIASPDIAADRKAEFGSNITYIPFSVREVWKRFSFPWFKRQLVRFYSSEKSRDVEYQPILTALKESEVLFSLGGDNITMDYGYPEYFLRLNTLTKKMQKKLIIWGASIGPFPNNDLLSGIVENLSMADLITVRESLSVEYLSSIGVTKNVRRVADPAFLLPYSKISLNGHLPRDGNILGFNISPLLSRHRAKKEIDILRESFLFLKKVLTETRIHVALIPHVIHRNSRNNDYVYMSSLYEELKNMGNISLIPPNYNAQQLKYVISRCRFFIGARTHATIAAFSTMVPTISIGYSLKSRGINLDIFGNDNYVLAVDNFSSAALFDKFEVLKSEENRIREILTERIPVVKQMSWDNVRFLKEVIKK